MDKKFWQYLRSVLRRAFLRYPTRIECLMNNRIPYVGDNKRRKWTQICTLCTGHFKVADVQVDHIVPCGSLLGVDDIVSFILRLFCGVSGLRVVCKPCHKQVTALQRKKK